MCAMLGKHSGRHKNYTGFRIVVELKSLNCGYCGVEIKALDHCKLCRSSMYHEPSQFSCGVKIMSTCILASALASASEKAPYELRRDRKSVV